MANQALSSHTEVARPLSTLASLIKAKLKEAEDIAEAASRPYWVEVGELLIEAKPQFDTVAEFDKWCRRQFGFGYKQAQGTYIKLVTYETGSGRGQKPQGTTLSEAIRSVGGTPRGHHGYQPRTQNPNDWRPQIDDIAERARREAERVRDEELTRQQERDEERKLAMRLIDIGYKVLAKELHPESGGSRDAMSRLNRVRDRLKAHA